MVEAHGARGIECTATAKGVAYHSSMVGQTCSGTDAGQCVRYMGGHARKRILQGV